MGKASRKGARGTMKLFDLLKERLVNAGEEKKATHLKVYDVKESSSLTDCIIVMGVRTTVQCRAVVRELQDQFSQLKKYPELQDEAEHPKKSGAVDSGWVVLDFGSIIVHVILEELREYYELDPLFERRAVVYHRS